MTHQCQPIKLTCKYCGEYKLCTECEPNFSNECPRCLVKHDGPQFNRYEVAANIIRYGESKKN